MAERFARGGRLVAFGTALPAARSDARHVDVEFVHPVIVGKRRALPALGLTGEGGELAAQVALREDARDMVIAMAFGAGRGSGRRGQAAGDRGGARARLPDDRVLEAGPGLEGRSGSSAPPERSDPDVVSGAGARRSTTLLWELVHVDFFEHRGLLSGRSQRRVHDAGASSFLYPFLDEREDELEPVVADVRRSVLAKAAEIGAAARAATLAEQRPRCWTGSRRGAARL